MWRGKGEHGGGPRELKRAGGREVVDEPRECARGQERGEGMGGWGGRREGEARARGEASPHGFCVVRTRMPGTLGQTCARAARGEGDLDPEDMSL